MKHTLTATALSLLLCAALFSCGQEGGKTSDTQAQTDNTADTTVTEETTVPVDPAYKDDLGAYDYNGEEFHFLLYGDGDPYNWSEIDVLSEGADGDTINDGIYSRNLALEERLNIKITGIFDFTATQTLTKAVQAGDDTYDAAYLQLSQAGSPAQQGAVYDWNEVPHIDMSKKYWDASIIRDLSVGEKVYFLTGDISTIDNQATWALMFNKSMVTENDLTSPYELVKNGTWTVDAFSEMTKNVTADINGDGAYTMDDRYGLATTPDTVYGLFFSTGLSFITKDSDNFPTFKIDVDKATDMLGKTGTIMNADHRTLSSDDLTGKADNVYIALRNVFLENRALFYAEVLFHVAGLRQMDTDFGILPMPKYDEAQEHYITFVNPATTVLTVPVTVSDLDRTGVVLEAMASTSYKHLTPAYYNTALQQKIARDNDSADMLDLLLQNRVYDLCMIYGWGSINSGYLDLAKKDSTDLASLIAKKDKQIEQAITKFLDAFTE